jgi:hypothetical protein
MNSRYFGYGIASGVVGLGLYLLGHSMANVSSFLTNQNVFNLGVKIIYLSYLFIIGGGLLIAYSFLIEASNIPKTKRNLPLDPEGSQIYCRYCGNLIRKGEKYCKYCGKEQI